MGETGKRIISGLVFAAFYAASFNIDSYHNILLYIFLFIAVIVGEKEFYTMTTKSDTHRPHVKSGIVFGLLILTLIYFNSIQQTIINQPGDYAAWLKQLVGSVHLTTHTIFGLLIAFIFVLFAVQIVTSKIEGAVYSIGTTLLGVFYVSICGSHLILLRGLDHGVFFIWMVSFATIMSDTAAYAAGKTIGRHKVGFAISPNKSWEGYIGGMVGQVLLTIGFYYIIKQYFEVPTLSLAEILGFATVIYIVSVLGDLSESLIKRDMGIKDSGSFIPGHGGLLDVIDALILTLPGAYYFLVLLEYVKTL